MRIKITRTYEVSTICEVDEVRDLNHLEMKIGNACEKLTHAVVDTVRSLDIVEDCYGVHDTIKKEIL